MVAPVAVHVCPARSRLAQSRSRCGLVRQPGLRRYQLHMFVSSPSGPAMRRRHHVRQHRKAAEFPPSLRLALSNGSAKLHHHRWLRFGALHRQEGGSPPHLVSEGTGRHACQRSKRRWSA